MQFTAIGERSAQVVRVVRIDNKIARDAAGVDCGHEHPTRREAEGCLPTLLATANAKWGHIHDMFIEIIPEWDDDDDAEEDIPIL
jgi:hypothetical protein